MLNHRVGMTIVMCHDKLCMTRRSYIAFKIPTPLLKQLFVIPVMLIESGVVCPSLHC